MIILNEVVDSPSHQLVGRPPSDVMNESMTVDAANLLSNLIAFEVVVSLNGFYYSYGISDN